MPYSVYLYKQTLTLPCRNCNSSFGDFNFNLINSIFVLGSYRNPPCTKMVFTQIFLSWKVHICNDILKTDSETFNCDRQHWHFHLSSVQRTPYLTRTLCNKHSIRAESTLSPHTLMPLLLPLNCPLIYCTHPSARIAYVCTHALTTSHVNKPAPKCLTDTFEMTPSVWLILFFFFTL